MAKLSWSTSNSQVSDEIYNVSSSAAFNLIHDVFYNKTGKLVEIWTGAGGTGTQLTISTDYTIAGEIADADLPSSISPDAAYTTIAITNAAYHSTDLYISYYPLGDYIEPGDFQENQGTANKWNANPTYATAGTMVERALMHFSYTGYGTNTNKDPLNQANLAYWYPSPGLQTLLQRCKEPFIDLHPTLDRASGDYTNLLKIDQLALDGTTYDFWMVALDGSTVTGDADLVAALDVGGANEHPLIDIIAPDSLGTRTLIDMGGKVIRAQSSSGKADTAGELQNDAMQRITAFFNLRTREASGGTAFSGTGAISISSQTGAATGTYAIGSGTNGLDEITFNSANSTSPNTAKTDDDETRMSNIVGCAAAILSMVPA